jgi:hypothetical protein
MFLLQTRHGFFRKAFRYSDQDNTEPSSGIKIISETKISRHKIPMDAFVKKTQNHVLMSAHFQRVFSSNINVKGAFRSYTCLVHVGT